MKYDVASHNIFYKHLFNAWKSGILTYQSMEIDACLEQTSSGHYCNCRFWHFHADLMDCHVWYMTFCFWATAQHCLAHLWNLFMKVVYMLYTDSWGWLLKLINLNIEIQNEIWVGVFFQWFHDLIMRETHCLVHISKILLDRYINLIKQSISNKRCCYGKTFEKSTKRKIF